LAELTLFFFPSQRKRTCLGVSCLILGWSRRLGFASRLNIGIREAATGAAGHAWLSIGPEPFCERATEYLRYPERLDGDGVIYWFGDERDLKRKADPSP
jgi:hypothetical protein